MDKRKFLQAYRAKRVFPQSITVDASNRQIKKDADDAFPDRRALAPFFADVDLFEALDEEIGRDVRASFFVAFERQFKETAARIFRLNPSDVVFSRFGFDRTTPWELGCCVRLQSQDARFFFVAPYETFLLFLLASLGFDVERICRDETLWRDLTARGRASTELERETLNFASKRLADFFPRVERNKERDWRGEFLERPTRESALDDEPCYWEERALEINAKRFPWRLCFPFSNFCGKNAVFPVESASDSVEIVAEIARGVVDEERWNSLKPGDVLTTETAADALFTVLIDRKPTFKARPGVFRGVTSVQLMERVDE